VISNLAFSIAIPIFILNSTKLPFAPETRLVIAILFPLLYGAFDWWRTKKHNFLALLGLVNVVITGGFGLMHLSGIWFSIKEAVFPLLIGVFVLISGLRKTPFFGKMLMSPEVFNTTKLDETLTSKGKLEEFNGLVLKSNHFLALSFFISAALNFIIAMQTFLPINEALDAAEKANVLNIQIALMHKRGFLGIAIPSMIMMLGLLFYYFKQVERITGESIETFFHQAPTKVKSTEKEPQI
jgi:intracellular septation protein A